MKNKLTLFFLLLHIYVFAQTSIDTPKKATSSRTHFSVNFNQLSEIELQNFLRTNFLHSKDESHRFKLLFEKNSAVGKHQLYQHFYNGIPVYGSDIKLNINKYGSLIYISSNLENGSASNISFKSGQNNLVWIKNNGEYSIAYLNKVKSETGVLFEEIRNEKGDLLFNRQLDLLAKSDTSVSSKLFKPDPLTSAQKNYGDDNGLWVNKNGADYPEIAAQRANVVVPIRFANDSFFAENKHAIILDLESPTNTPFTSQVANFDFSRNQSFFREFMVLYHISEVQAYLKSIGLDSLANYQIKVDPTAFQGQDQSRFAFDNDDPSLYFGTGGVPDAEDADVIVHEYTHAINYSIAPNSTNGLERLAFEEANCDFMATQYSKAISDYNWRKVFNWDGHNVYWDGRNTDTNKKYPTNVSSDFYSTSEIWSSMLNDLSLDLGREVTTKLLLGSTYFYTNNMSMQDAADLLVMTDSLLYSRAHYFPIKNRLQERGFAVVLSVDPIAAFKEQVQVLNTNGFANGTSALEISNQSNKELQYKIYTLEGKLIQSSEWNSNFKIESNQFTSGIYLLEISNGENAFAEKIVKY
ncbi:MAG: T9SS type A sorting domain-containing protein [Bacteroidia bacterium]